MHFAWGNPGARVPVLEVFLGIYGKEECPSELSLLDKIKDEIHAHTERIPLHRSLEPESHRRQGESPLLPAANEAVSYRRYQLDLEGERPLWPAPRRVQLPDGALCQYTYDVYVHDAEQEWVVVIFKELDQGRTVKQWQSQGVLPAELAQLPRVDEGVLRLERHFSLATLRLGPAAETRMRFWK